jgi:hypothetical protein
VLARANGVPGRDSEIRVPSGMIRLFEVVRRDIGFREVGDRIATRLEE